ncbi:hypothetical protein AGMMS50256_36790 [Betaproteobacteria bacterium]|nr:hypothetical protein AGMMS50256_36790 [Betaproteobacteria bacterium]
MNSKTLIASILLASSLYTGQALASPDLTPEQLGKAKETASQMKPPVDFEAMLKEADRLGVECTGDLTRKIKIASCSLKVDTAQSEERQVKIREETIQIVNDLADKAEKKLKQ